DEVELQVAGGGVADAGGDPGADRRGAEQTDHRTSVPRRCTRAMRRGKGRGPARSTAGQRPVRECAASDSRTIDVESAADAAPSTDPDRLLVRRRRLRAKS